MGFLRSGPARPTTTLEPEHSSDQQAERELTVARMRADAALGALQATDPARRSERAQLERELDEAVVVVNRLEYEIALARAATPANLALARRYAEDAIQLKAAAAAAVALRIERDETHLRLSKAIEVAEDARHRAGDRARLSAAAVELIDHAIPAVLTDAAADAGILLRALAAELKPAKVEATRERETYEMFKAKAPITLWGTTHDFAEELETTEAAERKVKSLETKIRAAQADLDRATAAVDQERARIFALGGKKATK